MKIKMETEEFVAWCNVWNKAVEGLVSLASKDMDRSFARMGRGIPVNSFSSKEDSEEEEDSEEDSEENSEEEDCTEHPECREVFEAKEDTEGEQEGSWVSTEEFDSFGNLLSMWLINFDQDGEQPDRGEYLRNASTSKQGVRLHSYLKKESASAGKVCLTMVTYDWLQDAIADGNEVAVAAWSHASLKGKTLEEFTRQVAENITQVSSIVFYQISDFLEYPNPLEK